MIESVWKWRQQQRCEFPCKKCFGRGIQSCARTSIPHAMAMHSAVIHRIMSSVHIAVERAKIAFECSSKLGKLAADNACAGPTTVMLRWWMNAIFPPMLLSLLLPLALCVGIRAMRTHNHIVVSFWCCCCNQLATFVGVYRSCKITNRFCVASKRKTRHYSMWCEAFVLV